MHIVIFGAGGLGAYYGVRLQQAGHQVSYIARGAQLEALQTQGIQLFSSLGDVHLKKVTATADPNDVGIADAVIVGVKTWQIPDVAVQMKPLVGDATVVVPFLNGVEASDQLREVLGDGPVLGGLSRIFSMLESPGVVRHVNADAYVEIGELNGEQSVRVSALIDVFEQAGVDAVVSADIRTALWKKLITVTSWAGIGALSRHPLGVLRELTQTRDLINQGMDEGIAVARAMGCQIEDSFKQQLWSFYDGLPDGATASMQRDMMQGKASELDAWNGAVVRYGQQKNVPTPLQMFTYHTLLPQEQTARKSE